jgi:hypothetical protein
MTIDLAENSHFFPNFPAFAPAAEICKSLVIRY